MVPNFGAIPCLYKISLALTALASALTRRERRNRCALLEGVYNSNSEILERRNNQRSKGANVPMTDITKGDLKRNTAANPLRTAGYNTNPLHFITSPQKSNGAIHFMAPL